jgi:hypothetical protein
MRSTYRFAPAIGVGSPQRRPAACAGAKGKRLPRHRRTNVRRTELADGKTRKEAIRYLKRRLCDVVDRHLVDDEPNR